MILIESAELKRQKTKFNNDFEKRMSEFKEGVGKKPRRTKFPQQQYACACPTMRTYHDDVSALRNFVSALRNSIP